MAEYVEQLKLESDEASRLKLDVLRALVVFGGSLWLSEIPSSIERLYLGERAAPSTSDVKKALKDLASRGLVRTEERVRGTDKPQGEKDVLVLLADGRVRGSLLSDEVLNRYYLSLTEELGKLRKE
ncbi:hypothetical protein IG193_03165 [Infirmifilum lucidum]|uniref:Uncharacterized protein n=1 Tax=Infirmifilum lucidum TaxID=2776706 RepID=A0A7L9FKY4_9CREN|nr:hypothetical protein [Infirmifilum lucidum]QOJ79475.1 hypothetical protein IG193_03165 [Infirmifilum lucidum]